MQHFARKARACIEEGHAGRFSCRHGDVALLGHFLPQDGEGATAKVEGKRRSTMGPCVVFIPNVARNFLHGEAGTVCDIAAKACVAAALACLHVELIWSGGVGVEGHGRRSEILAMPQQLREGSESLCLL